MFIDELFVPIEDFPEYQISSYGTVLDANGDEVRRTKCACCDKPKVIMYVLSPYIDKVYLAHIERLVAEAFFTDYEDGIQIYQINGDVNDCSVLNLTFTDPAKKGDDG